MSVPSPADAPMASAAELIEQIRSQGGRVLRMKVPPRVYVLTNSAELAEWLEAKGATLSFNGMYQRARGGLDEWDYWISQIPVSGERTVWEEAA